jgi:1,4-alpha-glucan branching enzyme
MIRTDSQGGMIFSIHAPDAELVEFTADFNGHRERTLAMRRGPGGEWAIRLHPGLICDLYRFRVDGRFMLDPDRHPTIRGQDGIDRTICPSVKENLGIPSASKTA